MGRPHSDNKRRKKPRRPPGKEKDGGDDESQGANKAAASRPSSTETSPATHATAAETAEVVSSDVATSGSNGTVPKAVVEGDGDGADVGESEAAPVVVEKDVVEVCERKGTCAALLYARAIRALREIPEDAEFQNPASATDPLRLHIDACAAMLGLVYIIDEDAVIITDEIKELVKAVSFTGEDVHELRQLFFLKGAAKPSGGAISARQQPLPPLGTPRFLEDIAGNTAYDVGAYERRDVIVGKGVFIAAFALYNEDRPQAAMKILDDLIQCINEHNIQHHQYQKPQQRQRGKGGSSKSRRGGANSNNSGGDGNVVLCKCPNDTRLVARLLELRSQCHMALVQVADGHQALEEFKKARRDLTTAIDLNGPVEERMVRALIVFPAGLEESVWKESSITDLKEFIKATAIELDQCPCFAEYTKLYGPAVPDDGEEWSWPHVPCNEDSIVQWSITAPPSVRRVTSLLLGRRRHQEEENAKLEQKITLDQMMAWSACDEQHETRYNAFIALSVLLGTSPKSIASGLHMYLMAQLEKQAMIFHQFFDNCMREVHDRQKASKLTSSSEVQPVIDSLSWEECVTSWSKHWDEYPGCYSKEEFQKRAGETYHKQRPCVVCQKPTQKACSHCHMMPVCSDECLSRVWITHIKSYHPPSSSSSSTVK